MKMFKYLKQHFLKQMRSERGTWMAAAVMGSAVIGAGSQAGWFGGGGNSGGSAQGGGSTMMQPAMWDQTEGDQTQLSNYLNSMLGRTGAGQLSGGMQSYFDKLRKQSSDVNYMSTYGRPGERTGTMGTALEAGALTGLGARSTMAQTGKVSKDYADREAAIDAFFAQQGIGVMQDQEKTAIQGMMMKSQGPTNQQPVSWGATTDPNSSQWGALGGQLLTGALNKWGNQTPTTGGYANNPYSTWTPTPYVPMTSMGGTYNSQYNNLDSILGQYGTGNYGLGGIK